MFLGTLAISGWVLWIRLFSDSAVPGWASVVLPMYLLGGVQIFCIGIIGEYLGKTYSEVKNRPRFFLEKIVSPKDRKVDSVSRQRASAAN